MKLTKLLRKAFTLINNDDFGLIYIDIVNNNILHWELTINPNGGFHKDIDYIIDLIFTMEGDDIKELKVYPSGGLFDKITTSMMKNKTSSGLCIRQFKKYSIEKFYARDFTGDKKNRGCQYNICLLLATIISHLNDLPVLLEEHNDPTISGIKKNWKDILNI